MPGWISTSGMPMEPQSLRTKTGQNNFPRTPRSLRPVIKLWTRIAVAAILVLLVAGSYLLYLSGSQKHAGSAQELNATGDRTPGRNTAMLTIAGGRQIPLDSAANGTLATQDNVNLGENRRRTDCLQPATGDQSRPIATGHQQLNNRQP